jgi:hypothetical protein
MSVTEVGDWKNCRWRGSSVVKETFTAQKFVGEWQTFDVDVSGTKSENISRNLLEFLSKPVDSVCMKMQNWNPIWLYSTNTVINAISKQSERNCMFFFAVCWITSTTEI